MPETSVHEKRKDIDTRPTPTDVELIDRVLHSYFEPRADRNVVMHRSLRSLTVSIAALSARDLKEAASQETDIDVLMEALRRALAKNANHAALSQLQLTTRMQALLKVEGGSIKVGEVQKILGISRQAIARRREQGKLLALPLSRTFLFPAWQFSAKGMWPGMEEVLLALRDLDPWMKLAFLLTSNGRLEGKIPLEELRRNKISDVREAALSFGEQGAI